MKLHYKGKYNMDPETLPAREHEPGAVKFREAEDTKALGKIANLIALSLMIPLIAGLILRCGWEMFSPVTWFGGCLAGFATLFPHEFVHALCFRGDVFLYTNLKQGMLFVVGTESMSRARFIWMSLLPSLIFGVIPYLAAMIWPQMTLLGVMGMMTIPMGAGDYYNVYHALTQMPKGARTYMSGFHSYWYLPAERIDA